MSDDSRALTRLDGLRTFVHVHETKIRFLFTGAVNTGVGLLAYPALYLLLAPLRLHYMAVLAITQAATVTFSFLTNKFLVFRTRGNYLREYGKFIAFHLSYFLVNLIALPILVEMVGLPPVWGQTLFAIVVVIGSYFWYSNVAFAPARAERP